MSNTSMFVDSGYGSAYGRPIIPIFGHSQRPAKKQKTMSGYSGTGSMVVTKKKKKVGLRKSFKEKARQILPAKHLTGYSAVTIPNSQIMTMNITSNLNQGTSNKDRIGDEIFMEALKIEAFIQSATDANAYKYRFLVGYSGEEYPVTTFTTGNLTQSEIFLPDTVTTLANGIVNPKAFTVLYDQVIDLNSQIADKRTIQSFRATIPLKKNFPYQSNGSVYGKTQNLYCVLVSYGCDLAAGVATGSVVLSYDMIFRD